DIGRPREPSFFFFQAEDGIRDYKVTGVQTCALPISRGRAGAGRREGEPFEAGPTFEPELDSAVADFDRPAAAHHPAYSEPVAERSEERRVGKEWTPRGVA